MDKSALGGGLPELLAVFLAGGTGCCLRLLVGRWVDLHYAVQLPNAGTLAVNLIGCFAIGLLSLLLADGVWRVAILVGLLGGFTTYSSFALLTANLATGGRLSVLAIQVVGHVGGGLLCAFAGLALGRALGGPPPR